MEGYSQWLYLKKAPFQVSQFWNGLWRFLLLNVASVLAFFNIMSSRSHRKSEAGTSCFAHGLAIWELLVRLWRLHLRHGGLSLLHACCQWDARWAIHVKVHLMWFTLWVHVISDAEAQTVLTLYGVWFVHLSTTSMPPVVFLLGLHHLFDRRLSFVLMLRALRKQERFFLCSAYCMSFHVEVCCGLLSACWLMVHRWHIHSVAPTSLQDLLPSRWLRLPESASSSDATCSQVPCWLQSCAAL